MNQNMGICRCPSRRGIFFTLLMCLIKVDNSATNGKPKSKRKGVELWDVSKKTVNQESNRSYDWAKRRFAILVTIRPWERTQKYFSNCFNLWLSGERASIFCFTIYTTLRMHHISKYPGCPTVIPQLAFTLTQAVFGWNIIISPKQYLFTSQNFHTHSQN